MGLLVLGPVGGVGEPLGAVELLGEFAGEGLVTGVRPKVDFAIFQASKRSRAAFKLTQINIRLIRCRIREYRDHIALRAP